MQFLREKEFKQTIPQVKIEDGEEISYDKVTATLRRSIHLFAALQADDGHWPAENAGPNYFMQPLVSVLTLLMLTHTIVFNSFLLPASYSDELIHIDQQNACRLYVCISQGILTVC